MTQKQEIPVYLFTGFLDAGKTTFIQETMEDPAFNDGQRTLLLVCEEGEAEYSPVKFASSNVRTVTVEEEEDLTTDFLEKIQKESRCEKVVVEYNGMWMLDTLYNNMPEGWVVYQEMTFADAETFLMYNDNMRNLTVDKMKSTETIVFKHFTKDMDKMPYHKIVRTINRRCDIIYEYGPDNIELDNIEDPLPFDINAPVIEIQDKDYAMWYSDMNDDEEKYYGKTVKFKGRTLLGGGLDDDEFVIGRHIMTCCVQDIQFGGLVAKYADSQSLEHGGWAVITAKIQKEYNKMYQSEGPVYHVINLEKCQAPEEEVATFY
ncbi:MAG: hypothetical protein PUH94_00765 [Firmicutes bacterium]|nr:hypothetical protein [Bacillota bacterium]MDY5770286.1 hypothetical protein [Anaerovoracaceae bacterium]